PRGSIVPEPWKAGFPGIGGFEVCLRFSPNSSEVV
ncbi:Importin subunit beta-1, partial [Fusarium oxysporum f. sp. albedinis]